MRLANVLIIGCGPAGGYCAYELAQKGIDVLILDHSIPREKPCGGGITQTVLEKFPIMKRFDSAGFASPKVRVFSCINKETETTRLGFAYNISRKYLDQEILSLSIAAGAKFSKEKVIDIRREKKVWKVKTNKQFLLAKTIIGADGINSIVRRRTVGQIHPENLGLGYGNLVKGVEKETNIIKFLEKIPGYIWIFPRGNHSCIGIGSELKYGSMLRKILDDFVKSYFPQIRIISRFSAMLPMVTNPQFFTIAAQGSNWILIGDAAGHADPITGEGILYALWSAKLASEAIKRNDLESYDKSWREEYGNYLKERSKQRELFFDPLRIELMTRLWSTNDRGANFF